MTIEEAQEEIPDIDSFCLQCCDRCTGNDWYCPSECEILTKARKLDFARILKCYAQYCGDLSKVARYLKGTNVIRKKGGY